MCLVGFASIAIVVVCGRCVLHRLFATTCKHPCLKPLGTHAKASLPLYERSVGFASLQSLWVFISGVLALLAPPVASTLSISTTFAKEHLSLALLAPPVAVGEEPSDRGRKLAVEACAVDAVNDDAAGAKLTQHCFRLVGVA